MVEGIDGRLRVDGQEPPRVAKERPEARGIELRWLGPEHVASPASLEPLGAQRLAQVRGVALQGVPNGLGRLLAPYLVDQHVGRYQVVGAQEQVGEDRSLLGSPECDRAVPVLDDLDRAEDPELHRATVAPGRRDGNAGCHRLCVRSRQTASAASLKDR